MLINERPQIAIISPNTLIGIGLRSIIEKMMPGVDTHLLSSVKELPENEIDRFFHYFVTASVLLTDSTFFLERKRKIIVLVQGDEAGHLPQKFTSLNINLPEEQLVKSILKLEETAHSSHHPQVVEMAKDKKKSILTQRETEVLRLIVSGMKNREIAEELKVGLSTIITHRKNITEKLQIKNVSGLTIYAVSHGIIQAEEI